MSQLFFPLLAKFLTSGHNAGDQCRMQCTKSLLRDDAIGAT